MIQLVESRGAKMRTCSWDRLKLMRWGHLPAEYPGLLVEVSSEHVPHYTPQVASRPMPSLFPRGSTHHSVLHCALR